MSNPLPSELQPDLDYLVTMSFGLLVGRNDGTITQEQFQKKIIYEKTKFLGKVEKEYQRRIDRLGNDDLYQGHICHRDENNCYGDSPDCAAYRSRQQLLKQLSDREK